MIQPKIQTIYTEVDIFSKTQMEDCVDVELSGYFKEESLITFTPKEFETFKREFGKELLEKAAKNATSSKSFKHTRTVGYRNLKDEDNNIIGKPIPIEEYFYNVNTQSITEVLDEYLLNNKI